MTESGNTQLIELARRWAKAMATRSNVPLSQHEATQILHEQLLLLGDALTTEPFDTTAGNQVGDRMIAHNMAMPAALGETFRLLNTELLPALGLPEDDHTRARLSELISALATNHVHGVRNRIFADQETIKTAVIRARDETAQAQRLAEARFRTVFNATMVGMGISDLRGNISETNPALGRMLGYTQEQLSRLRVQELVHPQDWPALSAQFRALCLGHSDTDNFIDLPRLLRSDGEPVWSRVVVSLVRDELTREPSYPVAMVENTSDMHLLSAQLQQQSVADRLTGLANENRMRSQLEDILAKAQPESRVSLSFWDLDGFRVINDGLGRAFGDEVLTTVAARLRAFFDQHGGLVARTAGDGFAVVLADAPDRYATSQLVQQAMNELAEPFYPGGGTEGIAASASVGIVVEPVGSASVDELIRSAEITLHRAKTSGKAQWLLAEADTDAEEKRRCRLGAVLPGALETGEFVVRYQPSFHLGDGSLAGVQAMAFWDHPGHGLIRPEEFMPLAEETGMVAPLGRWLLNDLCEQAARWYDRFGEQAPTVSVPIAGRMMRDPDLVRDVNQILHRHRLPANKLQLSVAATALLNPSAVDTSVALAENDVRMGVTGVGAGGLSLTRLPELPLYDVSMNPALVETVTAPHVARDSPFERGLTCLVSIAHDLACTVTAGELRDKERLDRLRGFGVDIAFGSALQPVGTPEAIETLLDTALAR